MPGLRVKKDVIWIAVDIAEHLECLGCEARFYVAPRPPHAIVFIRQQVHARINKRLHWSTAPAVIADHLPAAAADRKLALQYLIYLLNQVLCRDVVCPRIGLGRSCCAGLHGSRRVT